MANLWTFFGLPNPDAGPVNQNKPAKPKKQTKLSEAQTEASQQTLEPLNENSLQTTVEKLPKKVAAEFQEMKIPIPPNWTGPVSADGEPFHDLGVQTITRKSFPSRALRYVAPDEMKRIPTRAIGQRVSNGDTVIVDLRDLVHMDVQQNACRRELKTMSEEVGVGIFSLDSEDKILLVPGSDVIVDVENHQLGLTPLI